MWTEIVKNMAAFPGAVLTSVDRDGYPFSQRCRPEADPVKQVLRVMLSEEEALRAGPACLLFHRHDDRLWNLKSFVVRGILASDSRSWYLAPQVFIPGMGIGGLPSYGRFLVQGRRTARRYLAKRGLARPRVAWEALAEMMSAAVEVEG
jgi:hypothetical protein